MPPVDVAICLLGVRVPQLAQKGVELLSVLWRNLDPREHLSEICSMIPVVEQCDVPPLV
jgi:hypothetical protein